MINVKLDKGAGTMSFGGSGQEIAAEIGMIVRELYVQLYRNAGPLVAKGCKAVILSLLGEKSPVWDVNVPGAQSAVYMSGAAAEAMLERMRRAEGGRQHDKDRSDEGTMHRPGGLSARQGDEPCGRDL